MLKKARKEMKDAAPDDAGRDLSQRVLDSWRQIWLAGLGAFARAQQEGSKLFETLVAQGESLESRTRKAAADTAAAARGAAAAKAKEMQAMAGGTWDKLEQVFEDRVARALSKLGVHTQGDVKRLTERVDALSEAVNALIKTTGGKAAASRAHGALLRARSAASAGGSAAKKSAAKKTATKKNAAKKSATKKSARDEPAKKRTAKSARSGPSERPAEPASARSRKRPAERAAESSEQPASAAGEPTPQS